MPKGQYARKPKVIGGEVNAGMAPASEANAAALRSARVDEPGRGLETDRAVHAVQVLGPEVGGPPVVLPPTALYAADLRSEQPVIAEPEPENYEDWLDEEDTTQPATEFVTAMVNQWAGSFMRDQFTTTWMPVNDGASISVTLVTDFGTSTLVRPAGAWTEADITAALKSMREELRV